MDIYRYGDSTGNKLRGVILDKWWIENRWRSSIIYNGSNRNGRYPIYKYINRGTARNRKKYSE